MIDLHLLQFMSQELACAVEAGIKAAAPSLRDHLAGLAMQGIIATGGNAKGVCSSEAYAWADAMLAAREAKTGEKL